MEHGEIKQHAMQHRLVVTRIEKNTMEESSMVECMQ